MFRIAAVIAFFALGACASGPPPRPVDPNGVKHLMLSTKQGPFDGAQTIFVVRDTLTVVKVPAGLPSEERRAVKLSEAEMRELDRLAAALVEAPEPAAAGGALSGDARQTTLDVTLWSGRERSVFAATPERVWWTELATWLGARARRAETAPVERHERTDSEWRPTGWND